ncbi:DUF2079 domain-containing protein [Occultella glacieicola]|uniref:DUF2079 domain-containing protein n=1 Tax=Occultella glacieicola TaxID=2518684 RepID=A0ABY2EBA9_9MICO|nr:DUF2079 domain-containing protein [Occultella glacieicola]TDE97514.1 DUF2079 domain-containing protein [Occultella glacieicola]
MSTAVTGADERPVHGAAGAAAYRPPRRAHLLMASTAVGLVTTLLYTVFSWRQWARFQVPSWDLGIFTQILRAYSEGRAPVVPIKGEGFMILGDHFHPLLVVLAPVYAAFPSGLTLLAAQAVLVGISAVVVTWCAVRHLGRLPGTTLGLAYGLSWGLQSAVASQFHEVALALPFLALSLAALVRRDHRAAALWALPMVLIKEDLGLTVAAIGVVIVIRGSRRLGAALAVGGVAAFVITTRVVLPALNPDGVWDYADDSIVSVLFTDPGAALNGLFTGVGHKAALVLLVFGVTGFLALRSPLALITLPTFAWRLTSDVPFHWSADWHYSAVLMPIVFLAVVDTFVTARGARRFAAPVGIGALILALVITVWFPLWKLTEPETYAPSHQDAAARQVLELIGDGAVVDTDITMMAYLAPRADVYWVGNEGNPVPDYVVVNRQSGIYGGNPPSDVVEYATSKFPGETFVEVLDSDGFLVAEHVPQAN